MYIIMLGTGIHVCFPCFLFPREGSCIVKGMSGGSNDTLLAAGATTSCSKKATQTVTSNGILQAPIGLLLTRW